MSSVMSYSAFFYGTLMHPAILRRVIKHEGDELELCPAVLLEHTRHKVQYADYPGIIPYTKSQALFTKSGKPEPPPEDRTVRGTYVKGLNEQDIALLDHFEGNEYSRECVQVHTLGPFVRLSSTPVPVSSCTAAPGQPGTAYIAPLHAPSLPPLDALVSPFPAQTYIFTDSLNNLSPELWSYEDFVRDNAWKWVGSSAREENYVFEVDRRNDMDGQTSRTNSPQTGAEEGN